MRVGTHTCFIQCYTLVLGPSSRAWHIVGVQQTRARLSVAFSSVAVLALPFIQLSPLSVSGPLRSNELLISHLPRSTVSPLRAGECAVPLHPCAQHRPEHWSQSQCPPSDSWPGGRQFCDRGIRRGPRRMQAQRRP